jgi:hypothetical protein
MACLLSGIKAHNSFICPVQKDFFNVMPVTKREFGLGQSWAQ